VHCSACSELEERVHLTCRVCGLQFAVNGLQFKVWSSGFNVSGVVRAVQWCRVLGL